MSASSDGVYAWWRLERAGQLVLPLTFQQRVLVPMDCPACPVARECYKFEPGEFFWSVEGWRVMCEECYQRYKEGVNGISKSLSP